MVITEFFIDCVWMSAVCCCQVLATPPFVNWFQPHSVDTVNFITTSFVVIMQGDVVKSELLSLLDELPEIYKGIATAISGLENVTQYYETFVNFLVPRYVNSNICCHQNCSKLKVGDN